MRTRYVSPPVLHVCFCIILLLIFHASLHAQKKITRTELDAFFMPSDDTTRVIHFSSGQGAANHKLILFMDYLHNNKKEPVEAVLLVHHADALEKEKFKAWYENFKLIIPYYKITADALEYYTTDGSFATYCIDHERKCSTPFTGSYNSHKETLLDYVKPYSKTTIDIIESEYLVQQYGADRFEVIDGEGYYLVREQDWEYQGTKERLHTYFLTGASTDYIREHHILKITASGQIDLGGNIGIASPDGLENSKASHQSWFETINHGKLLALTGDKTYQVGSEAVFAASPDAVGFVSLQINDKMVADNSGSFKGKLQYYWPRLIDRSKAKVKEKLPDETTSYNGKTYRIKQNKNYVI